MQTVMIWSEGTRIAADLYHPVGFDPAVPEPAIVLCHGWGGVKAGLQRQAQAFADAGFVALAIDYRGWGESESKVVIRDGLPKERTEATARVQVIREVVDPFDELWDIRHALDWLEGEAGVDRSRLGLWGSSFGGGLVLWMAAHDERVKCIVSQVAWHDARGLESPRLQEEYHRAAIRQARGEEEPVPQRTPAGQGLRGAGHGAKFYYWAPLVHAEQINVPVLLIDAEHEELFDRHTNSERVYERMKLAGRAPVEYHVLPGISHYQIYNDALPRATALAVDWFRRHLQPA
jgi:dipeptidyl aminopeptidase/acylaminoacyl peptidase